MFTLLLFFYLAVNKLITEKTLNILIAENSGFIKSLKSIRLFLLVVWSFPNHAEENMTNKDYWFITEYLLYN